MPRALLFGTFDTLHEGHHFLMQYAREKGYRMCISLPSDKMVQQLKGRLPAQNFEQRSSALQACKGVDHIYPSDAELGSFDIVYQSQPDAIILGYDQRALSEALIKWLHEHDMNIPILTAPAYEPERYKTSLLRSYD